MGTKYEPKKKRALDEHGNWKSWKEDKDASEEVFKRAGTTREAVEAERRRKIRMKHAKVGAMTASDLSTAELEQEIKRRRREEEEGVKAVDPKPVMENSSTSVEVEEEPEQPTSDNLEDLTVPELQALMEEKGWPYPKRAKKTKLIELLRNDGMPTKAEKMGD